MENNETQLPFTEDLGVSEIEDTGVAEKSFDWNGMLDGIEQSEDPSQGMVQPTEGVATRGIQDKGYEANSEMIETYGMDGIDRAEYDAENQQNILTRMEDKSREITDASFLTQPENIYAGRVLHKMLNGYDFTGTNEELANQTVNTMSRYETTMLEKVDWLTKMDDMTEAELLSVGYLIEEYAEKDWSLDGFIRGVGYAATAPENAIVLPSGGTAAVGTRSLAQMLAQTLKKKTAERVALEVLKRNKVNIAEGAAYFGAEDALQQNVEMKTPFKENFDFEQNLNMIGMGALVGVAFPELIKGIGKGISIANEAIRGKLRAFVEEGGLWASDKSNPESAFGQYLIHHAKNGDENAIEVLRLTLQQTTGEMKTTDEILSLMPPKKTRGSNSATHYSPHDFKTATAGEGNPNLGKTGGAETNNPVDARSTFFYRDGTRVETEQGIGTAGQIAYEKVDLSKMDIYDSKTATSEEVTEFNDMVNSKKINPAYQPTHQNRVDALEDLGYDGWENDEIIEMFSDVDMPTGRVLEENADFAGMENRSLDAPEVARAGGEAKPNLTIEATPEEGTEMYDLLQKATPEEKLAYEQAHVEPVIELGKKHGLDVSVEVTSGAFEGQTNPMMIVTVNGAHLRQELDGSFGVIGSENIDALAVEFGIETTQNSVAWYTPVYKGDQTGVNGSFDLTRKLNDAEWKEVYSSLRADTGDGIIPVQREGRIDFMNWDKLPEDKFDAAVNKAIANLDDGILSEHMYNFDSTGSFIQKADYGENTQRSTGRSGSSDLQGQDGNNDGSAFKKQVGDIQAKFKAGGFKPKVGGIDGLLEKTAALSPKAKQKFLTAQMRDASPALREQIKTELKKTSKPAKIKTPTVIKEQEAFNKHFYSKAIHEYNKIPDAKVFKDTDEVEKYLKSKGVTKDEVISLELERNLPDAKKISGKQLKEVLSANRQDEITKTVYPDHNDPKRDYDLEDYESNEVTIQEDIERDGEIVTIISDSQDTRVIRKEIDEYNYVRIDDANEKQLGRWELENELWDEVDTNDRWYSREEINAHMEENGREMDVGDEDSMKEVYLEMMEDSGKIYEKWTEASSYSDDYGNKYDTAQEARDETINIMHSEFMDNMKALQDYEDYTVPAKLEMTGRSKYRLEVYSEPNRTEPTKQTEEPHMGTDLGYPEGANKNVTVHARMTDIEDAAGLDGTVLDEVQAQGAQDYNKAGGDREMPSWDEKQAAEVELQKLDTSSIPFREEKAKITVRRQFLEEKATQIRLGRKPELDRINKEMDDLNMKFSIDAQAITKQRDNGSITPEEHKSKYDVLLEKFKKEDIALEELERQADYKNLPNYLRYRHESDKLRHEASSLTDKIDAINRKKKPFEEIYNDSGNVEPRPSMTDRSSYNKVAVFDQILIAADEGKDYFGWINGHLSNGGKADKRELGGMIQNYDVEMPRMLQKELGIIPYKADYETGAAIIENGEKSMWKPVNEIGNRDTAWNSDRTPKQVPDYRPMQGDSGFQEPSDNPWYWRFDFTPEILEKLKNAKIQLYSGGAALVGAGGSSINGEDDGTK